MSNLVRMLNARVIVFLTIAKRPFSLRYGKLQVRLLLSRGVSLRAFILTVFKTLTHYEVLLGTFTFCHYRSNFLRISKTS